MASKQKPVEKPVVKQVVEKEVETSFDERTQVTQPWLGTKGVDDTRPEPQIVSE